MDDFMASRSFKDPKVLTEDTIGSQVLASLATVLFEYVKFALLLVFVITVLY